MNIRSLDENLRNYNVRTDSYRLGLEVPRDRDEVRRSLNRRSGRLLLRSLLLVEGTVQ